MGIKEGDRLKDNDPRSSHRVLTITALGMITESGLQSVRAKGRAGPEVSIAVRRIHGDGKARRSGFDLVPTDPPGQAHLRSPYRQELMRTKVEKGKQ